MNIFQRLLRQWDQIHPYNAAQVLRLTRRPALAEACATWDEALRETGLGRVRLDGHWLRYEAIDGRNSVHAVTDRCFERFISEELNRPFDDAAEPPFRPFILGDGEGCYLGIIYHHWVADSVSIRMLLREWFVRLFDPSSARRAPLRLARAGYGRFMNLADRGIGSAEGLLSGVRWISALKRVRRLEVSGGMQMTAHFALRPIPEGWLDRAHELARQHGATLNDLFLAAMAIVSRRRLPMQYRAHRPNLALGAIVDLRSQAHTPIDDFGLFLGFTSVIVRPYELGDPVQLLRAIASQGWQQKHRGVGPTSALRILAGVIAGKLLDREGLLELYRKRMPLAAGISNVNMNRSWAARYYPDPIADYIRVSPTGPLLPLVFATTTFGQRLHLAITYRTSVLDDSGVEEVARTFAEFVPLLEEAAGSLTPPR